MVEHEMYSKPLSLVGRDAKEMWFRGNGIYYATLDDNELTSPSLIGI